MILLTNNKTSNNNNPQSNLFLIWFKIFLWMTMKEMIYFSFFEQQINIFILQFSYGVISSFFQLNQIVENKHLK